MARVENGVLIAQVCVCRGCGFTGMEHTDFEFEPIGEEYCIKRYIPPLNEVIEAWGQDEVRVCPGCGGFHVDSVCDADSERGKKLLAQFRGRSH